jgi:hypothetical protein
MIEEMPAGEITEETAFVPDPLMNYFGELAEMKNALAELNTFSSSSGNNNYINCN